MVQKLEKENNINLLTVIGMGLRGWILKAKMQRTIDPASPYRLHPTSQLLFISTLMITMTMTNITNATNMMPEVGREG